MMCLKCGGEFPFEECFEGRQTKCGRCRDAPATTAQRAKHTVIVSIAVQAVLEVESEFNEQGVYCTVAWPQGGTSPFLFSAVPIGPPVRPEEAAALGRAAMTDVAQKLLARISESDTRVEPAAVLTPPKSEVN